MKPKDLKGIAKDGLYGVNDGNGQKADINNSVFPLIKYYNQSDAKLVGTGFFISNNGLFVTAKHVLMDVFDSKGKQKNPMLLIQFQDGVYYKRPVLRCTSHNTADISVGVAAPMKNNKTGKPLMNKMLTLTSKIGKLGSKVFTYAYPRTVINNAEVKQLHFYADYYDGEIQEYYLNGRDRVLMPGASFSTSMYVHGGASGGPVF